MGHNGEVGHIGEQIYIYNGGAYWCTKYTFVKVGHIGEMGHIGAQIYIRKSRHTAKVGTNRHNLEKVGTWEKDVL